jgi:hypothetical protein
MPKKGREKEREKKRRQRKQRSEAQRMNAQQRRRDVYNLKSAEEKEKRSQKRREAYDLLQQTDKTARSNYLDEDFVQDPLYFEEFEHNPIIARDLFWENTGAYRFFSLLNPSSIGKF